LLIINDISPRVRFLFLPSFLTYQNAAVEAGRMTMEAVAYSLRRVVFGILKTLVMRASQNNLDLTCEIKNNVPDQLIGNSLRLRQVITDLVGDAIKPYAQ